MDFHDTTVAFTDRDSDMPSQILDDIQCNGRQRYPNGNDDIVLTGYRVLYLGKLLEHSRRKFGVNACKRS